jgi:hypothetical protein
MYINLSQATTLNRLTVLADTIGVNATMVVYDGIYPASPDIATSANTLVTFPCSNVGFGNVAVVSTIIGNSITNVVAMVSYPIPPQFAIANGNANWARISDQNGNAVVDMDVGVANAAIIINNDTLISGMPVQVVSVTILEA